MAARKKRPAPRRRAAKRRAESFRLHVVSDATGSLARHLLSAVLTQFPTLSVRENYHLFKQDRADVEGLLRGVRPPSAIVCYALVNPEHKAFLQHECDKKGVPAYDLTGGLATFLSRSTGLVPVNDPDRLHVVDAHYQRRIEAMEYRRRGVPIIDITDSAVEEVAARTLLLLKIRKKPLAGV